MDFCTDILIIGFSRYKDSISKGVARMIERLDLKAKRSTQSGEDLSHGGETSNLISEGKGVLDHLIASSQKKCVVTVGDSNLHERSQATCSMSSHKDISCAESIKLDKFNVESFQVLLMYPYGALSVGVGAAPAVLSYTLEYAFFSYPMIAK